MEFSLTLSRGKMVESFPETAVHLKTPGSFKNFADATHFTFENKSQGNCSSGARRETIFVPHFRRFSSELDQNIVYIINRSVNRWGHQNCLTL